MANSVSVIIPVRNSADTLRRCLQSLHQSTFEPLECIVVDDGSNDSSATVAKEMGARVISTRDSQGPAKARNLGANSARGSILFFIDSDVCVYPSTLRQLVAAFDEDPGLDALIGSYDDSPASPDFLSQYKNLMNCFVHQSGRREASTFWSGCGAIRREVFFEHSGFDESYGRPAIEDIELGYRLVQNKRKVMLDPDLQVKHLKRWTFWNLVKTDILDRGIPWTELILRDQNLPNDLNLQLSQRVSVALVYLLVGFAAVCAVYWRGYFLVPLFALLFFLLGRYWLDGSHSRSRSALVCMTLGVLAIVALAYQHHMIGLISPVVLGYSLLFIRHRYALSNGPEAGWGRLATGLLLGLCLLLLLTFLPAHPLIFAFFSVLALIIILNNQFYLFLAGKHGRVFALAAIPFHLLYHFYNGISFAVGLCRFSFRVVFGKVTPPRSAEANSQGKTSAKH